MSLKRFMVIDGNSLLHRAFHALPPLQTKDGIYTNGVYGFLTMLNKIVEEYSPEYICVVFDKKVPTFRHKEYTEYKANRAKTPDELIMQFDILKDVLKKLNITTLEIDGFEADDIAGTLASIGEKEGLETILVTGDKDYLQLATENIKVLITRKGITNLEIYDEQTVKEKYGINPNQLIDLKGLMGDKSDNIPGVPGIGEKTGIKLIKEFGSLEGIYENLESISGKKLKERLIENRLQAFMSKKLAKIVTEVPINVDLQELRKREPDYNELIDLYRKLEFNSLLNKIRKNTEDNQASDDLVDIDCNYEIVQDLGVIDSIIQSINKNKSVYLKFIQGDKIIGLTIKTETTKTYYIDLIEEDFKEKVLLKLKDIFEDENIEKKGHHLKEDILILLKNKIHLKAISFDSMIGQYIINPSQNSYSIKELAKEYLSVYIKDEDDILGKGKNRKKITDIPLEDRAKIFSVKLEIVSKIENLVKEKIQKYNMNELYYKVELPLVEVLAFMEFEGFAVDIEKLKELGEEFESKMTELTEEIYSIAGEKFNINSTKQLGYILFEKLELPVIKKTKTGYSTNAEVLEKLKGEHPIIEKILEYRRIMKLKTTYVDGLLSLVDKKDNKIHSTFNQTVTTTGRISSTEPNLQNIPIKTDEGRKIRKVFIPSSEEYKLVDADYSQIELRVLAHITDDPNLKEAFYNDEDIHTKTASEVFNVPKSDVTPLMRSRAKAVNFGIIYGISDYGLARDLNISRKEAKLYIESYFAKYKKVKEYMDNIIKEGKEKGYVTTIMNRRRYLPELKSRNFNIRSFGERMAMNTPIQGSAADIIKIAMVNVFNELKKRKLKSKLILQVHDELIIEAHKDELEQVKQILKSQMENAFKLSVPLKVDMKIGDSWYETK
ncbi:DNA polymerase I [Caloranaerobacter azorensis DSM 13643]|uniref:DNA polymerase I n=1 Tax=Caloranaerobacter azorensis DSM 13643 TaxID=1121264 RepID=A0A1M5WEQ6_9FIRM|nr:DNA polymerase I [Caloranaerobacter azorensis]SHH85940.1 DNA polymerase I [Caloranaerobacter azorensis DSM 13643]